MTTRNADLGVPSVLNDQVRVLMIVTNPCTNDTRVIKEAEALAAHGYSVCVVCKAQPDIAHVEVRHGVRYVRVRMDANLKVPAIIVRLLHRANPVWRVVKACAAVPAFATMAIISKMRGFSIRSTVRGHLQQDTDKIADGRLYIISRPVYRWLRINVRTVYRWLRITSRTVYRWLRITGRPVYRWLRINVRTVYRWLRINVRTVYRWLRINVRTVYRWLRITSRPVYRWLRVMLYRLNAVFNIVSLSTNVIVEIMRFRPHVIHAHDLATLPTAARAATAVGAKIVYDAHELERHRNGLNFLGRVTTAIIETRSIHKADRVITVCDSIADFLAATYKIMRPAVVMNAPDPSEQHTVPRTIRDSIGLERNIPLAVYVGKLTFGRGLEKSVEALQYCKEFHLALLGPRVASVEQDLLHLAYQRGVLDRVHVLDSVPPHDVVPYISTADVGVIPIQDVCLSYRFCMPNKLFEMTFAGIPVCVSDLPEMRAFIESERTGLIMDQTDPKDIARAMREAYRDRHQLRATGDRLKRINKRYSWSTQVEQLLSVYRDLSACRS